jgi:serine phosphatase RsbU (regulator of sigma subunit)
MSEETILVVDDEIANLQKLQRAFINRYSVLSANSGGEALQIVQKNKDIAVIIADQRMPGMTGIELLQQSMAILPHAIRIILTGYTDVDVLLEAINSCKVYRYIVKPWDPPDLLMTVERGLEAYSLAKENDQFRKELIRRERLARELEIASEIQRYILPARCPALDDYEMMVEYQPAREVGGDFYDFQKDGKTLQLVVGDVSGKSIPAALYGAVFSGQLQTLFSNPLSPAEKLRALNSNLIVRYPSGNYIAVAYCRIDLEEGAAILANSGMPFPFLVRAGGVLPIEVSGAPLGLLEGSTYEEIHFQLAPGDTLLFASDGMTDTLNSEEELYDMHRFVDSICRHSEKQLPEFMQSLHSELYDFKGRAELSDDITIVALRRKR